MVVTALWGTMLLGMVKRCFKLILLALYYFWCVFGILFLSAFLIETVYLIGASGIFSRLISVFFVLHCFGNPVDSMLTFCCYLPSCIARGFISCFLAIAIITLLFGDTYRIGYIPLQVLSQTVQLLVGLKLRSRLTTISWMTYLPLNIWPMLIYNMH